MLVPKGAMIFCGLTHNKLLIAIHPSPRSLDEKELVMNTAVWDALIASFCMRLFGCKSIEAVQNHGDFWVFAGVIYIPRGPAEAVAFFVRQSGPLSRTADMPESSTGNTNRQELMSLRRPPGWISV